MAGIALLGLSVGLIVFSIGCFGLATLIWIYQLFTGGST